MGKATRHLEGFWEGYLGSYIEDDSQAISPGKGVGVDGLVEEYIAGYPAKYLQEKYHMSAGQIFSHLRAKNIPLRKPRHSESTLLRRLSHLQDAHIEGIIQDYLDGVPNKVIYERYRIHKNGLYTLLDTHSIERKTRR